MTQTQYYSTNQAQWRNFGFDSGRSDKAQANQNYKPHEIARRVVDSNLAGRIHVLAQIYSPTGQVHVHNEMHKKLTCFPQSVCWRFPEQG